MSFQRYIARIKPYCLLMRLHKPIGILLLLWPTLWALFIAAHKFPKPHVLFVFIVGVCLMRSAGCVINDFADRQFDGHVARTKKRPMVTGQISPRQAIILFATLCCAAFLIALTLNWLSILMAIPAVLLATIYPFMKRITQMPQLVLGLAFSWGIPMAFAAQTGFIPNIAWLIMLANILWTIAYDTQYAMVDRKDDIKIGIRSTAILFGKYDRAIIALLQAGSIAMLCLIGYLKSFAACYYVALFFASVLFTYQQNLIKHRQPENCFNAFLNNHWVGLIILIGILASTLPI